MLLIPLPYVALSELRILIDLPSAHALGCKAVGASLLRTGPGRSDKKKILRAYSVDNQRVMSALIFSKMEPTKDIFLKTLIMNLLSSIKSFPSEHPEHWGPL